MTKLYNREQLKDRRRNLRRSQTDAESKLWHCLRSRRFLGLRFVRQFSVGSYILDFYCATLKLAIELDGGQHNDPNQQEYDRVRTEYLNALGIRVMRFWNHDVLTQTESVLAAVKLTLPSL